MAIISTSKPTQGTAPNTASYNQSPSATFYVAVLDEIYPQANLASISGSTGTTKGLFVSNLIASFLGVNTNSYPEVGSSVLVMRNLDSNGDMDYIMGVLPPKSTAADWESFSRYIGTSSSAPYVGLNTIDKMNNQGKMDNYGTGSAPMDLVEGECLMENAYGVGLALLNNLASLKGSDLAKIECFVLDDFVRILSEQFEHITAFGEYKILNNDGCLNVLWKGTSDEYEAFNLDKKSEQKEDFEEVSKGQLNTDLENEDPEKVFYQDGRWRFSQYIGKLGNFIHLFLTDPQNILQHSSDEDTKYYSGRFNIHVNQDGSLLVQSTGDIVFEKVCRIVVPIEKVRPEELDFTKLQLDAFAAWKPFDKNNLFLNSYAIKDYSKWFSNYYSLATFIGLKDNFELKPESKIEQPLLDEGNQDLKSAKGVDEKSFQKYLERYATIRIFRDASVMLLDGWGDCVHLSGGSINLSAAYDININALNNVNIVGRNINALAKEELDLTAVERGMLLKSNAWMESRCMKGPILIQSSMNKNADEDSLPDDPEFKSRVENAEGNGIILKTDTSNIYMDSSNVNNIIMNSQASIHKSNWEYFNTHNFTLERMANFSFEKIDFVSQNVLTKNIYTRFISSYYSIPVSTTQQMGLMFTHDNEDDTYPYIDDKINDLKDQNLKLQPERRSMESRIAEQATFKYIPSSDSRMSKNDHIYENITQQLIRSEGSSGYEQIAWAGDPNGHYGDSRMNYPMYPGNEKNYYQYTPKITDLLNGPCTRTVDNLKPEDLHGTFNDTTQTSYFYNPNK